MRSIFALAFMLLLAATPALAETGQALFNDKCADCHTTGAASTDSAPSLKGVVGRPVASLKDFAYSDALKAKGGTWTEAALDAFLAAPQTYAPGTSMFGGAPDPGDRKAIIDYLKTVK
jgi:cytochrome c